MITNSRFIFVHNPKTGGTSITEALGGQITEDANLPLFRVSRNGRFAFGFVRNPWSRMVSMYHWAVENHFVHRSFKAWLTKMDHRMTTDRITVLPLQRRSQMWWLHGCDFIGRFETLQADFNHAVETVGLGSRSLPHINQSDHGDWRGHYDRDTTAFVQKHFVQDIDRFGYRFDARVN